MRLAFIKKRFFFHGGAERYLQTLLTYLKSAGHEIHIFANQWSGQNGIFFHKVDTLSLGSFLSTITFNENVKRAIKKDSKPDCVISFERTTCQDIYRAGEGCHSEWLEIRSKFEPLYKRLSFKINPLHISLINLEKRLFSNTRLIVANSKMVKEQIIKHYAVPEERITVIYNGVDLIRFTPENKDRWHRDVRKSLNISNDSKVLLFVGSGFKRKGLKTLINAIPIIKREDIKALIIGKGDVKEYKTLAEKYGISDKIIFLGPRKDIEKLYAAADIFVLPTLYDPFSNASLEAMASGLPVITTKNNGASELIEKGHEGFVLDNLFDAQELADKIYLSLDNLKLIGERARKKAEQFPIEKAVPEFITVIEQLKI
ncbi:MAG: glycosyltransferase family 4 protein [Thermodesulfovibrionales bacterium]|nr:glycosyltransferase family 4 protein [Thermodesulfovibrionales bacterium]